MSENIGQELQAGISAVRSGNKKEGARLLGQVVRNEPQNTEGWFWLAAAAETPAESAACLERVLKIDPNHQRARDALNAIRQGTADAPTLVPGGLEPMPSNMRPLNTGELLKSPPEVDTPYGSYTPPSSTTTPPPPFSPTTSPAPFGNDPTPPPPFGMPAWANQPAAAAVAPPPANVNVNVNNSPPPPPFGSAPTQNVGGVRLGQLDPAAAAAQEQARVAAAAQVVDANADLRRSLLNEQAGVGTPPIQPAGRGRFAGAGTPRDQEIGTRRRRSPLLPIILGIVAFVVIAAIVAYFLTRNSNTTTTPDANATTPPVTTEVPTTAPVTTAPVATTAPVTTAAPVQTTIARPNTTVAVPTGVSTPIPAPASPRPPRTGEILPTPTPPPTVAGAPPIAVSQYVSSTSTTLDGLELIQGKLNSLIMQPFRDKKITPGSRPPLTEEISGYLLLGGQQARKINETNAPEGVYDLSVVAKDYASDIREMVRSIESFYQSGEQSYLTTADNFYKKAQDDLKRYRTSVQKGYPYTVPIS